MAAYGVVAINKKNDDDGLKAIDAAFAGRESMKHVWIVDSDIDITNPQAVEMGYGNKISRR